VVTFILCDTAPFDHKYVEPALDVSVTLPPAQKVVAPIAVIVGCAGTGFTVTATFELAVVIPSLTAT